MGISSGACAKLISISAQGIFVHSPTAIKTLNKNIKQLIAIYLSTVNAKLLVILSKHCRVTQIRRSIWLYFLVRFETKINTNGCTVKDNRPAAQVALEFKSGQSTNKGTVTTKPADNPGQRNGTGEVIRVMDPLECNGFKFYANFDSANLARVENVTQEETVGLANNKMEPCYVSHEFNIWTRPDCAGTEFENGNRTWFYFGVKAPLTGTFVRLNVIDINKQAKMYSQGMAPVFKIVPGKLTWERIRDKLTYSTIENVFSVSFKYKIPDNPEAIVYFAFTYPYSYTDLQISLRLIDEKHLKAEYLSKDDIYYVRECVCKSLEGRRVDLITISSYHSISAEREPRLNNLFPDNVVSRPFKFVDKKVIFLSARVHPGETPSTFVLNGFLNLLLTRDDPVAAVLRRHYVFKIIPFLNPDGVSRGHYRTDTSGTNLNRVYLAPSRLQHPSVYAARALLRYYHYGLEKPDLIAEQQAELELQLVAASRKKQREEGLEADVSSVAIVADRDVQTLIESTIMINDRRLSTMSLEEKQRTCHDLLKFCKKCKALGDINTDTTDSTDSLHRCRRQQLSPDRLAPPVITDSSTTVTGGDGGGAGESPPAPATFDSGLYLYVDMHGHASKKGIFMYGNHFDEVEDSVECMLLPKIMSLNNHNFHFSACNFTERNMYLRDRRDGMSREGSGRVAVLKLTGLVRSYTLECNYNSGRVTNVLPPTIRESSTKHCSALPIPPKYNPQVFEEVGRALAASILDLTSHNPLSRLPNSEFHSLSGIRNWLLSNCVPQLQEIGSVATAATAASPRLLLAKGGGRRCEAAGAGCGTGASATSGQSRYFRSVLLKTRSGALRINPHRKLAPKSSTSARTSSYIVPIDRKENIVGDNKEPQPSCSVAANKSSSKQLVKRCATPAAGGGTAGVGRRKGLSMIAAAAAVARQRSTSRQMKKREHLATASATGAAAGNNGREPGQPSGSAQASPHRRLKLREICWIKGGAEGGKALIAKYTTADAPNATTCGATSSQQMAKCGATVDEVEDNLIVTWDANNANPQVFTQKAPVANLMGAGSAAAASAAAAHMPPFLTAGAIVRQPAQAHEIMHGATTGIKPTTAAAAAANNRRPTFRVHNFRRNGSASAQTSAYQKQRAQQRRQLLRRLSAAAAASTDASAAGNSKVKQRRKRKRNK